MIISNNTKNYILKNANINKYKNDDTNLLISSYLAGNVSDNLYNTINKNLYTKLKNNEMTKQSYYNI